VIDKGLVDHDVIISSRISLARNLADFPFVCTCSVEQLEEIQALIQLRLGDCPSFQQVRFGLRASTIQQGQLLAELAAVQQCEAAREYFPKGFESKGIDTKALEDSVSSIEINGEDHFLISVTRSDGDLMTAWQTANELDDVIEERFPIAFSERWGYLTTSPADLGTAMRVSVTVFLPGLVTTQQTEKLFRSLQQKNLIARNALTAQAGASLETTASVVEQPVDLFQISNLNTLGVSEVDLIRQIEEALPPIINLEREARTIVLSQPQSIIELQVADAVQQLYLLALEGSENQVLTNQLLSRVRFGVSAGLVSSEVVGRVFQCFSLAEKRAKLLDAIANEQYSQAATIRDHIRLIEDQLSQSDIQEYGQ